jgi:hypothetical protein
VRGPISDTAIWPIAIVLLDPASDVVTRFLAAERSQMKSMCSLKRTYESVIRHIIMIIEKIKVHIRLLMGL